jgi:hypothetical protein
VAGWRETIVNAIHQVIERGIWDDTLTREQIGGRDVFVRTIHITQPDDSMRERYRAVIDARTFAPVRSEWENNLALSYVYDYVMPSAPHAGRHVHISRGADDIRPRRGSVGPALANSRSGAPVRATRVEANTKYGFYKVWVTNAPPYIVRTVLLPGPGGWITYELLPAQETP